MILVVRGRTLGEACNGAVVERVGERERARHAVGAGRDEAQRA